MQTLFQDLRYGARMLLKKPGFTMIAVLTLTLGIGANTAVFSLVSAALLHPYPHIETDRWGYIWEQPHAEGLSRLAVSMPNFLDWREQNHSFSDMVLWQSWNYNVSATGAGESERVAAAVITPNIFSALKLTPAAGRLFIPDDAKSTERPVVISYGLWQRAFGGDPNLMGKKISLNLAPHTLVGVAPPGFSFPPETKTDVWTAYNVSGMTSEYRAARGLRVAAKLKEGVSAESAQAELNVIAERLAAQYPEDKGYGAELVMMREEVAGNFRRPLLALLGALLLVLLLACVNIANLQLVRLEARRKEIALRSALGASRSRVLRQLLTENLLLVVIAGGLGLLCAPWAVALLLRFIPPDQIPWLAVKIDRGVLLVCAGVTLTTALVSGWLPAMKASRVDLRSVLAAGGAVTGGAGVSRRFSRALVVAQLALALIPLAGAGLLINSFIRLQRVSPGFAADHRLTLNFAPPRARYPDPAAITSFAERVRHEVEHLPGVREAGLVQALPFASAIGWFQAITRQDPKNIGDLGRLPMARYTVASPSYLEALGFPLKAGRTLTEADTREAERVVVINESLARIYFAGENPLGQQMWIGHSADLPNTAPRTVVGVVGDALVSNLSETAGPAAWVPMSQQANGEDVWRTMFLVVHTASDPRAMIASVRQGIKRVDKELPLTNVLTMEDRLSESLWQQRFTASVLGVFSLAALAIAVLGVFGITSYLVSQRTREIGVRMALGATAGDVFRMVMGEGLRFVLVGIGVGVAGALALTRFLSSLLFGVGATDPMTFVVIAVLLAGVALLACYLPARRAMKVDPMVALRYE